MRTVPKSNPSPELLRKLRDIKAFLLDVDGVLTDGKLTYISNGSEAKTFHVQDGQGIKLAQECGIRFGIITGHTSEVITRRAKELDIHDVFQGSLNKINAYEEFKNLHGLADEEIAYMGDDVLDLTVLKKAGLAFAPANAHGSVKMCADYVSKLRGGQGAVREVIDMLLQVNGVKF
jgi:3-deoxy-D-manno-octulosonate 8-phosphate phosphatase (KDO 8-P phosphatase)